MLPGGRALALHGRRDACLACDLAKAGIGKRGKRRDPHRRPACPERGKYGSDVLFFRCVKRGLGAAQSLGGRLDGFIVLIHTGNNTVNRLRCHDLCDSVNDMRYSQPLTDGYVECDECGHMLEVHDTAGCRETLDEKCPCPVRITAREVGDIRVREGLPRQYED